MRLLSAVFYLSTMRRSIALSPSLILLVISLARADAPTPNDLKEMFKQGDYAGVVNGSSEALAPGGIIDAGDRYKVDALKGEALLKLGQADAAVDAFTDASKETEDPRQAFVARATSILISRSKDFVYTSETIKPPQPKVAPSKPPESGTIVRASATTMPMAENRPLILQPGQFDIIDPLRRTSALAAMWTDERADAERTIKAKIALKTLPSINEALDRIHKAEPIAVAAGWPEWAQTKKEMLANVARQDANLAMKDMNLKLNEIAKDQVARQSKQPPKAMPQSQRDQLNKITEALNQMISALKALPEILNVDRATYETQLDEAATLQDKATTVLATD